MLRLEQAKLARSIKGISRDSAIVYPLARSVESGITQIAASLSGDKKLPPAEKEKALRSLVFFVKELGRDIEQQSAGIYEIPGALEAYRDVLQALLKKRPLGPLLAPLGTRHTQWLAEAFSQYPEFSQLDEITVYKRVASSPDFILPFLESKPGFRYADSLLLDAAAHDPMKLVSYLNKTETGMQARIRGAKNPYLQQIVTLSGEKNASELVPFIVPIAEKKMTAEEITGKRAEVKEYFQLLVNTLLASLPGDAALLHKPLRNGIRQKALAFYVNPINEMHDAADALRFAPVKDLRPQDLYYIITSCGEDLYTSSYLGLYKRLMEHFRGRAADSLFDLVQYDNFRVFLRLAANYNVLVDFLQQMPPESMKGLLKRFIAGIGEDADAGLERAMDIADSFASLDSVSAITTVFESELQSNLQQSRLDQHFLGVRLYSILLQVFGLVRQDRSLNKVWAQLGNYEILRQSALANKSGEIIQLVLFYGDEDGVASFASFLKLYGDSKKWEIARNEHWVSIRSLTGRPLIIYANRPLDSKEALDLRAQDSLLAFLTQRSLEPGVLVHRGHSYHLDKTLRRLTPSVKLAILGSCGGYNKAISIASVNPDVQLIGSKKMGTRSINDPIIETINETLLSGKDLLWPEIWKILEQRFRKDEATLRLFNEYFPPNRNLGLFVLKLFNFYNQKRLAA